MTTDKYEFEEIAAETTGWNTILGSNIDKSDEYIPTRIMTIAGETVAAGQPGYISSDGKAYLAQAKNSKLPCLGIFVDAGVLDDDVRLQRMGEVTKATWTWTIGLPVWLSGTVLGGLTQTKPSVNATLIGIAKSATTIILNVDIVFGTTTTTT